MIQTLEIKNFKSIKQLKLDCKRINIFIGEPNTGKSNILEALGLFSFGSYYSYGNLANFVRFERTSNLFYDEDVHEAIEVRFGSIALRLEFKNGRFEGTWHEEKRAIGNLVGDYGTLSASSQGELSPFKFYRFAIFQHFGRRESEFLLPPSGQNLLSLLMTHKELKSIANSLFSASGFRLGLRPLENKIEEIKQVDPIIISYPYSLVSDTLQRAIFYLAILLSNKDSILILEEPEAHAFPYYTKYLAETIALDEKRNQFFISTHNPYFLLPLVEKAPEEDVAVFITYFEDYQTKAKLLSQKEMEEMTEIDIFSNLDRFLEGR